MLNFIRCIFYIYLDSHVVSLSFMNMVQLILIHDSDFVNLPVYLYS